MSAAKNSVNVTTTQQLTKSGRFLSSNFLQIHRPVGLIDLGLLVTVAFLIFSDGTIFFFHLIFILLTFGAFFWKFRAFAWRAVLWVGITSVVVASEILAGETHVEEAVEIPMLITILVLVFAIARQRSNAEEALRRINEDLENQVAERTAELTNEIITHKQTEQALRKLSGVVEHTADMVIITDNRGVIEYINPAFERDMGYTRDEALGQTPRILKSGEHDPIFYRQLWETILAGRVYRGTIVNKRKNGQFCYEEKTITPIRDANGQITHFVSTSKDVTKRKQTEMAQEKERRRIARDLHDSLGQNLGYLRLKLDEFSLKDIPYNFTKIQKELVQMRDVANEAYEMVRNLLAATRSSNSADLANTLLAQTRSTDNRTPFKVNLTSQGKPVSLSPIIQQQVLYICQEALSNVEKHANAQHVDIHLQWSKDVLIIEFVDDGCGFATGAPRPEGHYGLTIMQERAEEINGLLSITSNPGSGTRLTLWLPLNP